MNPVMIDETVRKAIKDLMERAHAAIVPMAVLEARLAAGEDIDDPSTRNPELDAAQDEMSLIIPMGFKVVFTVEEHPVGQVRHLSMSSPTPGRAPTPAAVQMVMDEFGFAKSLHECFVYPETFGQDWVAINVIEPIIGKDHELA